MSSFQLGRSDLSSSSFQPHLLVLTLSEDRELFIKENKQLGNNAGQDPYVEPSEIKFCSDYL